jgi:predicted nucleic acid-binding protein
LTDPNDIKRLFEILKDFHIRAIDLHVFTDAYKLFEKYHEDIGLDLADWTTVVFIRDIEKAIEEVRLLSGNSEFDQLKDYKNEAVIPIERIEL